MQSTALTPLGALTDDERCSPREVPHLASLPAALVAVPDPRGWAVSTRARSLCGYVAGKRHRPSVVLALVLGGTNLALWPCVRQWSPTVSAPPKAGEPRDGPRTAWPRNSARPPGQEIRRLHAAATIAAHLRPAG
jgi:hypothetical protein